MMHRGDIYLVRFDPVEGSEARKTRPAVIVSHEALNRTASRLGRGVVTVVPLTTNVERVLDFQVFLPAGECGLERDSKAQAEQVRSLSVGRLGTKPVGSMPPDYLVQLDRALLLHLGLSGSRS